MLFWATASWADRRTTSHITGRQDVEYFGLDGLSRIQSQIRGDVSRSPVGSVMKAWGFREVTGAPGTSAPRPGRPARTGYVFRSACEPFLIGASASPSPQRKSAASSRGSSRALPQAGGSLLRRGKRRAPSFSPSRAFPAPIAPGGPPGATRRASSTPPGRQPWARLNATLTGQGAPPHQTRKVRRARPDLRPDMPNTQEGRGDDGREMS